MSGPPPAYPEQYGARTSGYAVASLACGIAGLVVVPVLASIAAVVLGMMARNEIRRDPTLTGDGLAVAGLVLGWIGVGLGILGVLVLLLLVVGSVALA